MRFSPLLAACASCAVLTAQHSDDRRDVVVTKNGREITGRVVQRFDPKEVTILQSGKRVHVPTKLVKSMTTVLDHMREFFELRSSAQKNVDRAWGVAEWAASHKLERFARLQALHVVAQFGDHEEAHELLGHKKSDGGWLWPYGSLWYSEEKYFEHVSDWGHPLVLDGEHFSVRTNAGLRTGLAALFDLERLYLWWFDEFGDALRPREVLNDLMDVHVHRSVDDFPAWTSLQIPYYIPQPNGDVAYTYVDNTPRPDLLFQLGVEQLLYNTLADGFGTQPSSPKDRFAAWLEIGLGQWAESVLTGRPGYVEPGKPALDRSQALIVLESRRYGLENMIGIRYSRFHDVADDTPYHWASVSTFVAFLMDEEKSIKTRAKLLEFVYLAYAQSKGASSSLLDKTLGTRIEKLERPWIEWVEKRVGVKARRKRR